MSANTAIQDDDTEETSEDFEETDVVQLKDTDNVGDASVEINVEELITELEADGLVAPRRPRDEARDVQDRGDLLD